MMTVGIKQRWLKPRYVITICCLLVATAFMTGYLIGADSRNEEVKLLRTRIYLLEMMVDYLEKTVHSSAKSFNLSATSLHTSHPHL